MSIGLDGSLLAHVKHTESLRASSETSSLNLFRQMRASRKAETPSSLRVKLSSAMTPRVVQMAHEYIFVMFEDSCEVNVFNLKWQARVHAGRELNVWIRNPTKLTL